VSLSYSECGTVDHKYVHLQSISWIWTLVEVSVILSISFPDCSLSPYVLTSLTSPTSSCDVHFALPFLFGWFLTMFGSLLRLRCYRLLGPLFTYDLGIQENHKLITTGPYAYVRHPSYLGAICTGLGVFLCYTTPGSWMWECTTVLHAGADRGHRSYVLAKVLLWACVPWVPALWWRLNMEDKMLKKAFGKEWEGWATRVPSRILPGIY
jgi:protein-S-isoprenylcysteine O-methyltransferase Ste14